MTAPAIDVTWDAAKAQLNIAKHGVTFAQAATVLADPLALTVFDAVHSKYEERWFTLGSQATASSLPSLTPTSRPGLPACRCGSSRRVRRRDASVSSTRTKSDRWQMR